MRIEEINGKTQVLYYGIKIDGLLTRTFLSLEDYFFFRYERGGVKYNPKKEVWEYPLEDKEEEVIWWADYPELSNCPLCKSRVEVFSTILSAMPDNDKKQIHFTKRAGVYCKNKDCGMQTGRFYTEGEAVNFWRRKNV